MIDLFHFYHGFINPLQISYFHVFTGIWLFEREEKKNDSCTLRKPAAYKCKNAPLTKSVSMLSLLYLISIGMFWTINAMRYAAFRQCDATIKHN